MSDRAIIESINKMTGQHKVDQITYVDAMVNSVDVKRRICSCTAISGHTEYDLPTVKLMAVVDDGLLLIPSIGSSVKVIFSQNIEPFVCQYSELDNIIIHAVQKIQLNDGSMGGLVVSDVLSKKLNSIEDDINKLKDSMLQWVPVPTDGGAALKTLITDWSIKRIIKTLTSDLQNKSITHGQ